MCINNDKRRVTGSQPRILKQFQKLEKIISLFRFQFLYLMAYLPLWVIQCETYPYKRTVVVLFNP